MNLFDRFVAAFFACMEVSMNVFEAVRENGITARQAAEESRLAFHVGDFYFLLQYVLFLVTQVYFQFIFAFSVCHFLSPFCGWVFKKILHNLQSCRGGCSCKK